ncbi:MAG: MFS transporter [Nitrososphaerota archaeon]|nr:MFS transporter [Nitrososphaerota archaeon]
MPVTNEQLLESMDESAITGSHVRKWFLLAFGHLFDNFTTTNITAILPILIPAFALSPPLVGTLISSVGLGGLVGAILAGPVSDMIGRKKTYLLATVLYGATDMITGTVVNSFGFFYSMRLIEGFATGFEVPIMAVYFAEILPRRRRGWFTAFAIAFGNSASLISPYIVEFTRASIAWRGVFVVPGLLGLLLIPFIVFFLPESVRYTLKKGDTAAAEKFVRSISTLDPGTLQGKHQPMEQKAPLSSILKGGYLRPTLALWAIMGLLTMGTAAIGGFTGAIYVTYSHLLTPQNFLPYIALTGLGITLAPLLGGPLMELLGRRRALYSTFFLGAICFLLQGYGYQIRSVEMVVTFTTLGAFFLSSNVPVVYAISAELYPTHIRNTAASISNIFLRGGIAFGPLLYGFFIAKNYISIIYMIGILELIAVVIAVVAMHETKGQSLEQITADLAPGSGIVEQTSG